MYNQQKRRPPQFYKNLRESLRIMIKSFKCGDTASSCAEREMLAEIERLLEVHSYDTCDLIHQYYIGRHNEQQAMNDSPYGQLTVRCGFSDDNCLEVNDSSVQKVYLEYLIINRLKCPIWQIEIINARNLVPIASNCDPFVRIQLSPEEKFGNTTKYKTNFQSKTLFPLFDEKFVM